MKKIPFSRSVESWHAYPYSTCRQVKISFLGMPQIAHFQVEKLKSSLPWEGGHHPPTPFPRSVATLPRAWSLRSLAKIVPPNVLAHYATAHTPMALSQWLILKHFVTKLNLKENIVDQNLEGARACCLEYCRARMEYTWTWDFPGSAVQQNDFDIRLSIAVVRLQ